MNFPLNLRIDQQALPVEHRGTFSIPPAQCTAADQMHCACVWTGGRQYRYVSCSVPAPPLHANISLQITLESCCHGRPETPQGQGAVSSRAEPQAEDRPGSGSVCGSRGLLWIWSSIVSVMDRHTVWREVGEWYGNRDTQQRAVIECS